VAFKKAMKMYENEDYTQAADAFETVISIGKGTDIGQRAQYLLAESYFKNGEYLMAASEYDRYSNLYPQSEKKEEADFQQAMCYYNLSPRYKLSQKHTRKAIELFELFISRYPDSDRVQQASDYIDQMRSKLAHKMFESAKLYQRTDEYEAAAIYYGLTTERYPETKWAEKAKVNQIFAYIQFARRSVRSKRVERYKKAVSSYEQYVQLFPEGTNCEQVEKYLNAADKELAALK
jgi:outer membrane protein assembly factor BamD